MNKHTSKEFNAYYNRAHLDIGSLQPWQYPRLRQLAFNAWQAGRKMQRSKAKKAINEIDGTNQAD